MAEHYGTSFGMLAQQKGASVNPHPLARWIGRLTERHLEGCGRWQATAGTGVRIDKARNLPLTWPEQLALFQDL